MLLSQQKQLQEQILQNFETVLSLEDQRQKNIPNHQRILESIATAFGQLWFLYINKEKPQNWMDYRHF